MTATDPPVAQPPPQIIPIPTRVPIQPQPFSADFDVLETTKGPQIGMRLQTALGVQIYMLTPDQAKAFAEQLKNSAVRASVGLVVPSLKLP